MAAKPKAKPSPSPAPAPRVERTSAVVTATLILLTALGIVTIFWEPLTALAVGAPSTEGASEPRGAASDGGATTSSATSGGIGVGLDASGSS